jgi:hypothetical protein
MGDWKTAEGVKRERQVSYTKALNNSVGPKQTKCNITEQIQTEDFNSFCVALTTTMTPDVPSGSSFQVMTKYCMMWAGGTSTRVLITCTIEWSKSSWIKGAIEKGANEGQVAFAKDLISELRKKLETAGGGANRKSTSKKKSSKKRREDPTDGQARETEVAEHGRGFSTIGGLAGRMGSIIFPVSRTLFSSTGIISFLFILVLCVLIRVERTMKQLSLDSTGKHSSGSFRDGNYGLQGDENLWEWVGTRIEKARKEVQDGQLIWNNVAGKAGTSDGMEDVEEAIRVTEGKLDALKVIAQRNRDLHQR